MTKTEWPEFPYVGWESVDDAFARWSRWASNTLATLKSRVEHVEDVQNEAEAVKKEYPPDTPLSAEECREGENGPTAFTEEMWRKANVQMREQTARIADLERQLADEKATSHDLLKQLLAANGEITCCHRDIEAAKKDHPPVNNLVRVVETYCAPPSADTVEKLRGVERLARENAELRASLGKALTERDVARSDAALANSTCESLAADGDGLSRENSKLRAANARYRALYEAVKALTDGRPWRRQAGYVPISQTQAGGIIDALDAIEKAEAAHE
jgi:hypothetical protein